ncbi:MAG: hypothetical protein PHW46_03510 [Candidatus Omnitrophica bacterium]|nr:hypothetical protein [Candidatus Omnitrophota bacterium]
MANRYLITIIIALGLLSIPATAPAKDLEYVEELFNVRSLITNQGKVLPDNIKDVTAGDLRTLERIFELNTSTLTTLEAYFRILKIALVTESESTTETVTILNEWLSFIKEQCQYDVEYLDATLKETTNSVVVEQIKLTKKYSEELIKVANKGLEENANMLEEGKKR